MKDASERLRKMANPDYDGEVLVHTYHDPHRHERPWQGRCRVEGRLFFGPPSKTTDEAAANAIEDFKRRWPKARVFRSPLDR